MPEPLTLTVLSGLASAVSAAVTGLKFVFDLKNTPVDVTTCLGHVARVNKDLQYLISLRTSYAKNLESTPEVLTRVDGVIQDAYESIQSVGLLLEGCRREAHGGQTPFRGRMKWVLADSTAFQRRTGNLLAQQAAINVEITNLRRIEALQPLRSLASEISFENMGMIPLGRRRSSSKLSTGDRPGMKLPFLFVVESSSAICTDRLKTSDLLRRIHRRQTLRYRTTHPALRRQTIHHIPRNNQFLQTHISFTTQDQPNITPSRH